LKEKILNFNLLETLPVWTFSLYFIFNFMDRNIANIFLLITLFICIINYKKLYYHLKRRSNLLKSIMLFTVYIFLVGFYHQTPLNELDNYFRFLLLLPLLIIAVDDKHIVRLLSLCAIFGLVHAYNADAFLSINEYPRYRGTSSSAITYAGMSSTMFAICLYFIFYKKLMSFEIFFSSIIFLILFLLTQTRGPILGIITVFIFLAFAIKYHSGKSVSYKASIAALIILIFTILFIPNSTGNRILLISEINIAEPLETENYSLRQRLFYLLYGIEEIKINPYVGIGPQHLESNMRKHVNDNSLKNIKPQDHLHNEFLDLILKFGPLALIFLLIIYLQLLKTNNDRRILLILVLIMLLTTQLTQSHFAHHQAISFFITTLFVFSNNKQA